MLRISQSPGTIRKILRALDDILAGARNLLIVLHDTPDPDAIAGGMALQALCASRYGIDASIAHGGMINRAENKAMVSELGVRLHSLDSIRFGDFDRIAVVDTQPGRGNNALSPDTHCHIVFDHHSTMESGTTDLVIYNKRIGATATLLGELLHAAAVNIKTNLATAIAYAIRTETLELQREASERDIQMYLSVYPLSSLRKIGAISWPKLPNFYFEMLAVALVKAKIFRHLIFIPIGEVAIPEVVAEMADLFLRRERVTWVLVMGYFSSHAYFSLRTTHYKGQAFRILQNILKDDTNAGGHDTFAGGRLAIDQTLSSEEIEDQIKTQFAASFGYKRAGWKKLINNSIINREQRFHSQMQ